MLLLDASLFPHLLPGKREAMSADWNVPEGLLWAGQIGMAALRGHGELEVVGVMSSFLFFLQWTEYKWSIISPLLQVWFGKEFFTFFVVFSLHSSVFGYIFLPGSLGLWKNPF